jgi:hypothetical protein
MLVIENGDSLFLEPSRLRSLAGDKIKDTNPDMLKKIDQAISERILQELYSLKSADESNRIQRMRVILSTLMNSYNEKRSYEIINLFAEALGYTTLTGNPPPPPPLTNINVRMLHPTNNSDIDIGLPSNIFLRDVFEQLIDANFLSAGQSYTGVLKSTGQRLDNNKTVAQNGIVDNDVIQTLPSITVPATDLIIGGIKKFAGCDWIVLDVRGGRALLLRKQIWDTRPYHRPGGNTTWENCTLRKELNDEFISQIPQTDRARIAKTPVHNSRNEWYNIDGGNNTEDFVWLLSIEEADRYFGDSGDYLNKRRKDHGNFVTDSKGYYLSNSYDQYRISKDANEKACCWWLRSPGNFSFCAALVAGGGFVLVGCPAEANTVSVSCTGVRPALWLNL